MKKMTVFLAQILRSIFGEINYQRPVWITNFVSRLVESKYNTKKNKLILAGIIATVLCGFIGKKYYDSLPKPEAVSFNVYKPSYYNAVKPEIRSLFVSFSKSVAPANMIGKEIIDGLEISPKVKGKWSWSTDRELKFTPILDGKIDWPVGAKYSVSISKKILASHIRLNKYDFDFDIDNIKASVYGKSFYQDPRFSDVKKVTANFSFNYPVDVESLKKRIKLTEKSENGFEKKSDSDLGISFNEEKNIVYLASSNIKITDSNREFRFVIEKGVSSQFGGSSDEEVNAVVKVPSLYDYFKITGSSIVIARNDKYESEQILRIENVAEIASEELFKSLEAYELPYHLDENDKKKAPHYWSSISEVTSDVLKRSKKIKLDLIPTEQLVSLAHSFRLSLTPGRGLYVKIPKNTTSFGGFKLKDDFESVMVVPEYPADLQFMGKGALIPMTGSKSLSIVSRNINKISYVINQIRIEHVNHLIPTLIYDYTKPEQYDLRPERIAERFEGEIPLINQNPQKTQFSSIDLNSYLNGSKKGLFYITLNSKDSSQYANDKRFIIITDLGMIVKKSISGNYDVFVQNISTGQPVAGAKVSVLGQNGLNILSGETGANGSYSFPNLKDFKNDKLPIAFVAQQGDNISFVPFNAYNREIDFTQFDVGGVRDSSESDQLNAYIFSDRGIYRPGEQADFGLIVRSKNWGKAFSQIPVEVTIDNPSGQQVMKKTISVSSNSIDTVTFKTEDFYQTGNYIINAHIMQKDKVAILIGTSSFQVEEFVPDQIKVRTSLSKTELEGWVKPDKLSLNLTAFNLYGKPASDRVARSKIKIKPTEVFFKKWKDYNFSAMLNSKQLEVNDSLPDQKTNTNGEVNWELNIGQLESSVYRLYLNSEVFETEGGRSVKAQLSQLVSDREFLLGVNTQQNDLSFIKQNAKVQVDLIAINPKLESIAVKDINVEVIQKKPTSVLVKLPNETYAYQTVYKTQVLKSYKYELSAKTTKFKIETDQIGEFSIVFKDNNKTTLNTFAYNVVGQGDLDRGLEKSTILKVGLNKKDYQSNDFIEVQIKSPYPGAGLITIERDKVYATKWFKSNSTSTVEKIQIPAGLEGQAYIVVTMLRDINSEDIYTSPLSFGVATFGIDLESRKANIDIQAPQVVKPGQKLNFKVKAESKTKAAIYLVDEGILQVANYKLPTPLSYFFQKKALQVNTYQILDLVMPDFAKILPKAAGGDEAALLGNSINPFKRKNIAPVAQWLGVFDLSEKWTDLSYLVPDHFNGNIKIMVVAADEKKLGSQSADVNVRGDFIINATTSTFTAPDDEFEVNLIVANQLLGSGEKAKVDIAITPSKGGYTVIDQPTVSLEIPENKEKSVNFKLKSPQKLGAHSIEVTAGIGNKKSKVDLQLSNRPAAPYMQAIQWMLLTDKEQTVDVLNNSRDEFKKNVVQFHTTVQDLVLPFQSFYEVNDYLCSEQIASKLIPLALKADKNKDEQKTVEKLISLLRSRQKSDGSFGLYPNSYEPNLDVSLHLGMIFLYMQEKGEPIPEDIWKRYLESLKSNYNQTASKIDLQRKAKAMYILVRSQFVPKEDLKNMAVLIKDKKSQKDFTSLAAMYLAASYKLAMQDDLSYKAFKMSDDNKKLTANFEYLFPGAEDFERQAIVLKSFPEKAESIISSAEFLKVIDLVNKQHMSTYSTSYLLMALDSILKNTTQSSALEKINIDGLDKDNKTVTVDKSKKIDIQQNINKIKFSNSSGKPIIISYVKAGFPASDDLKQDYKGIEINRVIEDESGKEIKSIDIGKEAVVKIRLRTLDKTMTSVLVNDLLPAGFEVVLNSIRQNINDAESNGQQPVYEDGEGYDAQPVEVDPENPEGQGENGGDGAQNSNRLRQYYWPLLFVSGKANAQSLSSSTAVSPLFADHIDVREDRVNIYAYVDENLKEYTYRIKAITKGKFKVPGIYAKGLYRTDLIGQGSSGQIEVK